MMFPTILTVSRIAPVGAYRMMAGRAPLFFGASPNPAGKLLHVRFSLPDDAKVDLRLYDITGRPLRWQEYQGPGPYEVDFGAGLDLKPGLYFLKLTRAGVDNIDRR